MGFHRDPLAQRVKNLVHKLYCIEYIIERSVTVVFPGTKMLFTLLQSLVFTKYNTPAASSPKNRTFRRVSVVPSIILFNKLPISPFKHEVLLILTVSYKM